MGSITGCFRNVNTPSHGAEQNLFYLAAFTAVLLLLFIFLSALFFINAIKRKTISSQAAVLSAIYDSIPSALFCKDLNGIYMNCNQKFEEFLSTNESAIIGKLPSEITVFNEELAQKYADIDKKVMNENMTITIEGWHTYSDKSRIPVEIIKTPLIQNNKVTGLLGIMTDITERKKAENAMFIVHERTKLMLDSIPLCCGLINKNYQCFDCNNESLRLFELKDKQEFLDSFYNLMPEYQPDNRNSVKTLQQYTEKTFNEGKCVFEWTHQLLDGTLIPSLVTLERVIYDNDYAVFAYVQDLREHKQMMSEIKQQNNLLNTLNKMSVILLESDTDKFKDNLLHSMNLLAEAVDVDRVRVWKNHVIDEELYCTQLYEWPDGTESKQGKEFVAGVSYNKIFPEWEAELKQGKSINGQVREMRSEVQVLPASQGIKSFLLVPVFLQDEFWGFVSFDDCRKEYKFSDKEEMILRSASRLITNALLRQNTTQSLRVASIRLESALEKAQEASRAKSDFLAKMSHEIRTPMNAIMGMTELALRTRDLHSAREHMSTVKQAGTNLLSIINDILDFSKIETGKLEIIPVNYSFSSLLNDVISIVRMRTVDSRIHFVVNIDSKIPNSLFGDEIRIRQILLNILSNAIKYTEKGFISFTVNSETISKDKIKLIMRVKDSGKGIKPENLKKLFSEYTQFDLEKNRGIEGTGLGLAITNSFVKMMNGDISVESEYGIGSTFTITLPQEIRSGKAMAFIENPGNKNVILYERRNIYARSIAANIENLGVHCTLVSSDAELHYKMSDQKYAFIFISYILFKKNKEVILKFGAETKTVVLAEFGETISEKNLNALAMPVHSITIAGILNGTSSSFSYSENNEQITRFTASGAKVLIVDDILTNLKVVEGLLLPYNMQVDLRRSGRDAIEALNLRRYDLVFMDHKMPDMDGVETTKIIRSLEDDSSYYKNVPIIALTANAVSGTKEMFLENGFNDFLSKPVDTVKLNSILEKWIPREKKEGFKKTDNNTFAEHKEEVSGKIEIEGIDAERGINLSGGNEDLYSGALKIYYEDMTEKTGELKACLETKNFELYAIYVHAVKCASANIGAAGLSESARVLEDAAERGDKNYIETHNPGFMADLELLLGKIKEFFLRGS